MNEREKSIVGEVSDNKKFEIKKYKKFDIIALILCLIISISIWIFVMNSQKADVEQTVTLQIEGIERIEELSGLSVIGDYTDTVSLTVSGSKAAIEKYQSDNYHIRVTDEEIRSRIEEGKAGKYQLTLNWVLAGSDVTFKSVEPSYITVYVDKYSEKTVPLTANYEGGIPINCSIGTIEPRDIAEVTVSGPETSLNDINSAVVVVSMSSNETTSMNIKSKTIELRDKDNLIVSSPYIKVEPAEIEVYVQLLTQKEVPLTVKYTATDSDKFIYKVTPVGSYSITLKGDTVLFLNQFTVDLGDITTSGSGTILIADITDVEIPSELELVPLSETIKMEYTVIKTPIETESAG